MLDLAIRGGSLIDGSGAPARPADLGIRNGRVAALGTLTEEAAQSIDASGRIVCPGFIDVHTHYDAQGFWDGTLSPSPFHGVTSVFGGNCGFSIAPLAPGAGDYLMRMLARVEGMPLESLAAGVPWDWKSFGDFLAQLEGRLAVNAGFLVGHSALRRCVMGPRAVGEKASPEEIQAMVALLQTSIREGGMGFSSSVAPTHNDGDGAPVPSRHASREELVALAGALRELPGTLLEFLPGLGAFSEEQKQLMTDLSLAANRPLNWNVLAPSAAAPKLAEAQLSASDYASERGATVVALTVPQPMSVRINLTSGFIFDALPDWAPLFRLPLEERKQRLREPAYRRHLAERAASEDAGVLRGLANWAVMRFDQVHAPALAGLKDRTVGEVAEERGQEPFDCLLDVALEDDLRTSFLTPTQGTDDATWQLRAKVWRDPRAVIGASDAGAHLDMIDTFAFTTHVLQNVRERALLGWEEAVHQLSDVPARLYGLRERGQLREGWHADIAVFDPERVGCGPTYTRFDLPAGAGRLYADAEGIEHVIVGGCEIVRHGKPTGATPGQVLRSGRDTETVEVPGSEAR